MTGCLHISMRSFGGLGGGSKVGVRCPQAGNHDAYGSRDQREVLAIHGWPFDGEYQFFTFRWRRIHRLIAKVDGIAPAPAHVCHPRWITVSLIEPAVGLDGVGFGDAWVKSLPPHT